LSGVSVPEGHCNWLIQQGIALSAERNLDHLQSMIVEESAAFSGASGAFLYLRSDNKKSLIPTVGRVPARNLAYGGDDLPEGGKDIPRVVLFDPETGDQNLDELVAMAALKEEVVLVSDRSAAEDAGLASVDALVPGGWRPGTVLIVPVHNNYEVVVAVLVLTDPEGGTFPEDVCQALSIFTNQAGIALDNQILNKKINDIGMALSAERNRDRLLERILLEAKSITNADGGTLYLRGKTERKKDGSGLQYNVTSAGDQLKFAIMRTDSLNIAMGGTTGKDIPFPPLRLYDEINGEPNHFNVATHVALTGETSNIPDAYEAEDFDFSGTKKFDKGTGYRSKSFLTVPLKNNAGEVIGVIQLLNAQDPESGEITPFSKEVQPIIEALASQAAIALDNQMLLQAQRDLLDAFIELIASAIDAKSPYTGGHCQRVPELTMMMAEAASESDDPRFADFHMDEEQRYELHIGAWLHDCGKVTTPEYVVDKSTKLETIYNRIHEIRMRFEVLKRDAVIEYYKQLVEGKRPEAELKQELEARWAKLDDDYAFIAEANVGGEFMAPEKVDRVKEIAAMKWTRTLDDRLGLSHEEEKRKARTPAAELPVEEYLLADKEEHIVYRETDNSTEYMKYGFRLDVPEHMYNFGEVYNLSIGRGTLTAEERFKINDHIVQTIIMLEQLPFPKNLAKVPEYAGGHHETMIGTGYPKKLKKQHMSLPARMMAIADIFEALTAADRPYKKAKKLSEAIKIMGFMNKDQHIDPDLFELFLKSGAYKKYAEQYLLPEQIDEVDIEQYLPKAAE
jgi:HD-GYP domain-containing protein (c-di-GMP phosphodiesterase class II)